jgi:hypothetical protein
MDAPRRPQRKKGEPPPERGKNWINGNGYVMFRHYGQKVTEHRFVMAQILGRSLHPWENVHHRNGRKTDNQPDNLELWITSQPRGQRITDLVRFILDHYPAELAAEMQQRAM